MRKILEVLRGYALVIGMTAMCLTLSYHAKSEGNTEESILWCLVLALLLVGSYLWWLIENVLGEVVEKWLDENMDEECAKAWEVGYFTGMTDEIHDRERADNPYLPEETVDE